MTERTTPTIRRTRTCGPFRLSEVVYPPGYRQAPHTHDRAGVTIVLAGAIRETAANTEETATALSVVVKPAGLRHADQVGPAGSCTLQIAIDPGYAHALGDAGTELEPWRWLHGPSAARQMLAVLGALHRDSTGDGDVEDAVLGAIAGVADEPVGRSTPVPDWLRRVREELDDRPTETVHVRDLAAAAGLHPVSLARAFRRHYGTSITAYRKRQRVRLAAHSMTRDSAPLGRIAYTAGYADQPHLCRDFREATGLTPSEFRKLSGTAASARTVRCAE